MHRYLSIILYIALGCTHSLLHCMTDKSLRQYDSELVKGYNRTGKYEENIENHVPFSLVFHHITIHLTSDLSYDLPRP